MNIEQVKEDVKALRQMERFLEDLRVLDSKELSLMIKEEGKTLSEEPEPEENVDPNQRRNPLAGMMESMFGGDQGTPMPKKALMVLRTQDMTEFMEVLKETIQRSIIERKRIIRNGILGIKSHGETKTMEEIVNGLVKEIEEENKPKENRVALFKVIGNEVIVAGKYITTGKTSMVTIEKGPGEYTELTGHQFDSIWESEGKMSDSLLNSIDEREIARDLKHIFGQIGTVKIVDVNLIK